MIDAVLLPNTRLSLQDGGCAFDSARWPHVNATVTLAYDAASLLDALDPRDSPRIRITANGRIFDLGVRDSDPDRKASTVNVSLQSDEAILGDFAQLVDDTGGWAFFTSVRGIVNYVLGKIGATLEPGTADADLTPYWAVTNLMPNPSVRGIVGNWVAGGANATLVREPGHAVGSIPAGADITTATLTTWSGNSGLGVGGAVANTAAIVPYATAKPFKTYTVSTWVYTNVAKTLRLMCQVFGEDGAVLNGGAILRTQAVPANTWTRIVGTIITPANASRLGPFVYPDANQQWTAGNTLRTTAWMIHEGTYPTPLAYFDGATPANANYKHTASGAAHASASTREPVIERSPDALTWRAGTSALDYLHPLVQVAGLRLVCDERRKWTLRPAEYRAEGTLTYIQGVNITKAAEKLSRSSEEWFDGAVFVYTWTDADGIEQTRSDAYSAVPNPTKVIRREIAAPYPGPGRAQYAVERALGRGRTVTVEARADWTEKAEQPLAVTLSGSDIQVGIANRVEFDFKANTVAVTSRTTDIPAGAIDLLPGTINALTGTINAL